MRFASLGSGSEGNALLIAAGSRTTSTHLMLDCGFGLRETERRLDRLGVEPARLSGIAVTHEHSDHIGGVFKLARRYRIPVWLSHGTLQAMPRDKWYGADLRICRDGEAFAVGDLLVTPYTVPHDAREPLQYLVSDGDRKLGVLTDAGQPTPYLIDALSGCDALLLEFNHDSEMLARSPYPPWLRERISGPLGHLSNGQAAGLLSAIDKRKLRTLVAAHLSQKNNSPALVRQAIDAVTGGELDAVIAHQAEGFDWLAC